MAPPSKLFKPINVGPCSLLHRAVMAPMTRSRATEDNVPTEMMVEYYRQRATTPGTLIITEATYICEKALGAARRTPGIWSQEQIAGWRKVTDAVHAKGSFIWLQIWALGRSARPEILAERGLPYVGASAILHPTQSIPPRPLTIPEIKEYVDAFATAAKNAITAGFDGVEVHSANGYLLDQFLQTNTNDRTDEYGGTVENRIRFADEVVDAVVAAIGPQRAGIRLSPWSDFQDMGMPDPIPTFDALVRRIDAKHPDLAFVHVIEPEATASTALRTIVEPSNAFIDAIRLPRPVIHAGGYTRESALEAAEADGVLVAFGQAFVANPDLPVRLRTGVELVQPDANKFYVGEETGYLDYPFASIPQGTTEVCW